MTDKKTLKFLRILILFLTLVLIASAAWGWGPQGHKIVAAVAQKRLTQQTLDTLRNEFNITHLMDVANWADRIKSRRKETRPWHYTNIPRGKMQYVKNRDCPEGSCVTEKIEEFSLVIQRRSGSKREHLDAVRFLVHFVADVHQPLHLGNQDDRGGNEIPIRIHNDTTNLHAVWDHDLIHTEGKSLLKYAAELNREITLEQENEWVESNAADWSNESRQLAVNYGYLLKKDDTGRLTREYLDRARKIVRRQLKKAGLRLAHRLNHIMNRQGDGL